MGRKKTSLLAALVALITLSGIVTATTETAINDGGAWLVSSQNPDGSWGKEINLVSTAFSIVALEKLGYDVSADKQLLLSQNYNDTKELALVFFATKDNNTRTELLSLQNSDGGWGEVSTTSLILVSLIESGYSGAEVTNAIQFLNQSQNLDGSWGRNGYTKETALATYALMKAGIDDNTTERGLRWLANHQTGSGSFDYVTDTSYALLALSASSRINETNESVEFLKEAQNPDGVWGIKEGIESEVYPSALAVFSLASHNSSISGLVDGADYLLDSRNPAGGWSPGGYGGSFIETTVALQTLSYLNYSNTTVTSGATAWLSGENVSTTDYMARKIETLADMHNVSSYVTLLVSYQNDDGGWGIKGGYESDALDSILALRALQTYVAETNISTYDNAISRGFGYLEFIRNPDGGWGYRPASKSDAYLTSLAILTLRDYLISTNCDCSLLKIATRDGGAWLEKNQNPDGGWGNFESIVYATATGYPALIRSAYSPNASSDALNYILSSQNLDGGWGATSNAYETSLALRALGDSQRFVEAEIQDVVLFKANVTNRTETYTQEAYEDMIIYANHTGTDAVLGGFIVYGNATIPLTFLGSEAYWNTRSSHVGDYEVIVSLVDRTTGIILDRYEKPFSIIPTIAIKELYVETSPGYIAVNTYATVSILASLRSGGNVDFNATLDYVMKYPNGTVLAAGSKPISVEAGSVIRGLKLAYLTENFTVPGIYPVEVNVTSNTTLIATSTTSLVIMPLLRIGINKTVSPEEVLPGERDVDVTLTLKGEGINVNVTKKGVDVFLVMDRSGSMGFTDYPPNRLEAAKTAAKTFVDSLPANQGRAGLVSFSGHTCSFWFWGQCWWWGGYDIRTDAHLTANKTQVKSAIDGLSAYGSTAIGYAMYHTRQVFASEGNLTSKWVMVLLTDGMDNGPGGFGSPSGYMPLDEAPRARDAGIVIYAIGIGSEGDVDGATLVQVANITGGKYYYAPSSEELQDIYSDLSREIGLGTAGRNITVVDVIPTANNTLNISSFSEAPTSVQIIGNETIVTWSYDTLSIGEEKNISYQLVLHDLAPGENRVVNSEVKLSYINGKDEPITVVIPARSVETYFSAFTPDTSTDKLNYSAYEDVGIEVNATNIGETPANITLDIIIEDAAGNMAENLTTLEILDFLPQEKRDFNFTWNTADTPSGDYRVHAALRDGDKILNDAYSYFTILPVINVSSEVLTDKAEYTSNEYIEITAKVRSLSPNFALENLAMNVTIRDANGTEFFGEERLIPLLVQFGRSEMKFYWNTLNYPPGNYDVTLEIIYGGDAISSDSTTISIIPSFEARTGLDGNLNVSPSEIRGADDVNFTYLAINTGNIALDNVTLMVSLVSPSSQEMVLNFSVNASFDISDSSAGTFAAERLILLNEDYLVLFYGLYNSTVIIPIDTAYLRVLATPRTLKNDSIALLSGINASDEYAQENIARAIEHIEKSLGSVYVGHMHGGEEIPLWLDDHHIDEEHGHRVFDEEKKAVKHLLRACSGGGMHGGGCVGGMHDDKVFVLACSFNATIIDVVNNLLLADELLANTSIKDAELALVNATNQEKVQRKIDKAYEELDKAYSAIAADRYAKAVDHFKKAWKHAQHAIRHAEGGRP